MPMLKHSDIGIGELRNEIKKTGVCIGGNERLKIYGTLNCRSGKRMKKENRVFFTSEEEAIQQGFRPCGHCMKNKYQKWKSELIQCKS